MKTDLTWTKKELLKEQAKITFQSSTIKELKQEINRIYKNKSMDWEGALNHSLDREKTYKEKYEALKKQNEML